MNPIELGKFIANLRNEKHITQEELADKLFIDKRKISRWECGTSLPEFDMLIKLSEILDVSLYELSICQRIKNEKISRRLLNKFKTIKDIKNYNRKRKLIYLLIIIVFFIFSSTFIYTIKNHGTVDVYELVSLDDNYSIKGNYFKIKNKNYFNIVKIDSKDDEKNNKINNTKSCTYEIYDNVYRSFIIFNDESTEDLSSSHYHDEITKNSKEDNEYDIKIKCNDGKNTIDDSFKITFKKIYDNYLW